MLESFRQQFEPFFGDAATGNASAQTSLRRALKLSLSPASGIVAGTSATGTVSVQTPPAAALTIQFQAPNGNVTFPESNRDSRRAKTATFSYSGASPGVEDVAAIPADPAYETAFARVQVAGAAVLNWRRSRAIGRLRDPRAHWRSRSWCGSRMTTVYVFRRALGSCGVGGRQCHAAGGCERRRWFGVVHVVAGFRGDE